MTVSPHQFPVLLTEGAAQDIEGIHRHILDNDGPDRARHVLDQLMAAVESLSRLPHRGKFPDELLELGIREYRQVMFKPYRVIYRMMDSQVFIYLIMDGRRDMQSALARRLLESSG